jgi:MYXO-CTERM domain-containing protein
VGLTAGRNGNQFLTAWDKQGKLIGQVNWVPANDASFIGLDTKGVPIGLVAYGNDDVFAGQTYGIGGSTIMADTWVWSKGSCANDAQCDDKDMCNGAEKCTAGKCTAGTPLVCDDMNTCTDDSCDKLLGCQKVNNVLPCEDADMCTVDTVCAEGVCGGGGALDCADDDVCTEDVCDPDNGCGNAPIDGCCKADTDCADDQICDLDTNTCTTPMTSSSSSGSSSGGESSTGEPSTTTDAITTGETSTTTGEPSTTTGEPSTTGEPATTDGSDTGGGQVTTTGDPSTGETPTTGTPSAGNNTGTIDSDGTTGTDTAGVDDGGCGCRTGSNGDHLLGALASLGLGLMLRRRRRS